MSTVIAKNVQVGTSGTPAQNFTVYQPASPDGTVRVGNGNSGSVTDLLTLNSSGNLGLGVAPSAWQSTRKALQIGGTSSLHNVSNNTFVANNFYSDTSGTSRYLTTGVAQLFSQESDGGSKWYTAPSGTAGNTISFTQAMTLDASGNLGVGATSPGARVDVRGTSNPSVKVWSQAGTSGNYAELQLHSYNNFSGFGQTYIRGLSTASGNSATALTFATEDNGFGGPVERARIDSIGNFGIGTTAPQAPFGGRALQVGNTSDARSLLTLQSSTTGMNSIYFSDGTSGGSTYSGYIDYLHSTDSMVFGTGSTERARITSSGNFGIGTSSPAYRLVVQDSGGETILGLNNTSTNGRHYLLISGGASGSYAGGRFGLYSVTNAVDLFAATTSTGSTAGGTTGNGVGFSNAGFWVDRGWGDYPSLTVCNNNYSGNTNQSQLRIHGTNATWASYPSAGGADFACSLYIDGTYQTGSDRRFKTNITVIENALDKVLSMTGKRFQTINSLGEIEAGFSQNSFRFGFIAQDLQAAGLDELYKHNVDEDDGTDGFNKAYCVEYDAVVPMLVNAIKELKAEFDAYKALHP